MGSQGGLGKSKEYLDLIKSIGEARSKAEEDRIVLREIETLKARWGDPNTSRLKMKEYIIRLLHVEMLGHDASFGYIHAVKMTHDEHLHLKRTGWSPHFAKSPPIDKNLSFLDDYIQRALENVAQPYIPESPENQESSIHALEAYERPEPAISLNRSPALDSSTEVPVPELSYLADIQQPTPSVSSNIASSYDLMGFKRSGADLRTLLPCLLFRALILSRVRMRQIKPISSGSPNTKASTVAYDSRKQVAEISPEKRKLAASLFGGASKSDSKQSSSSTKVSKPLHHSAERSRIADSVTTVDTTTVKPSQPPPDLLDLGEPSFTNTGPSIDPFKQLEGLLNLLPEKPASFGASTTGTTDSAFMEKTESIAGSRHLNLKKSFKRGLRSLLTACSEEEFRKAFPSFAAAEQERLHRLFVLVIAALHENIEEEFESILLETQVGNVLDNVEELVDEHSLDPLISKKSNVAETVRSLLEAKKNEVQYLMGMLKKAEEQRCNIVARLEHLKKEKQDVSAAANLVNEMRTAILNYGKAPHSRLVN
ncbi:hypothetical protein F511_26589 [Dorcoceras hygrometricum]|uniref:Uncharacterized protein n=1 Tax=Dorcoceras hygrometricum TaxID=472368 RepID=A0A2Z7AGA1_9LAMI|nr:hypothetical protein F511_26589 [Dorcoceras hygrometricum]